jgi:cytochrome P450
MELVIPPAKTSCTMCDAIRMKVHHPDAMEKAQAERDGAVGTGRLSNCDDEWMGDRVPKDSLASSSHYGRNIDGKVLKNPTTVDPSRRIKDPTIPKPARLGFGKRARASLYKPFVTDPVTLAMARVLCGYNFHIPKEPQSQKFVDKLAFHLELSTDI